MGDSNASSSHATENWRWEEVSVVVAAPPPPPTARDVADEEKEEGNEEWRGRNAVPRLGNEAADVSKELEQVGEGDEVDPLDGS